MPGERVQVEREGRDERLALAGLHLGDVALVQDDPAHHLDVEEALVGLALARLADGGEGLEEQVVERLAVLEPLAESAVFAPQLGVGEPRSRARASRCTRPGRRAASGAGLRRCGGPSRVSRAAGHRSQGSRLAAGSAPGPPRASPSRRRRAWTSRRRAEAPRARRRSRSCARRRRRASRRRRWRSAPARRPRAGSSTTSIRAAATAHMPSPRRTASPGTAAGARSSASASGGRRRRPSSSTSVPSGSATNATCRRARPAVDGPTASHSRARATP